MRKPDWAVLCGAGAFFLSGVLACISLQFAVVPLAVFVLLCLAAPFFPCLGFFLPVICRGPVENREIALTFDDGPTPQSTRFILDLLDRHNLSATFFVVGRQADQYPELIKDILAQGHTIGNHSLRHDSLLMLRSQAVLHEDIHECQQILSRSGIKPLVFRPPVGITGPRLKNVMARKNLVTVNYSCRAMDMGNRRIRNLARRILDKVRPGDIIMLHDLPPYREEMMDQWAAELERLILTLHRKWSVIPLEKLIHRPVMLRVDEQ